MCSCTETNNKHVNILSVIMQSCCCATTHSNNRYRCGLKDQINIFRTTQCVLNKAFAYVLAIDIFCILCI